MILVVNKWKFLPSFVIYCYFQKYYYLEFQFYSSKLKKKNLNVFSLFNKNRKNLIKILNLKKQYIYYHFILLNINIFIQANNNISAVIMYILLLLKILLFFISMPEIFFLIFFTKIAKFLKKSLFKKGSILVLFFLVWIIHYLGIKDV